jgi:hypothetical protein
MQILDARTIGKAAPLAAISDRRECAQKELRVVAVANACVNTLGRRYHSGDL